jgi:hypothetical protein
MLNAELFFFHRRPETEPFQHPVQFSPITADEIFRSGIILQTESFRAVQFFGLLRVLFAPFSSQPAVSPTAASSKTQDS